MNVTKFFYHAMKYQGGKKSMKFLNEMNEIIPFEVIKIILIEKNIYKVNKSKTGRPIYFFKDISRSLVFTKLVWIVRSNDRRAYT